MPKYQRQDYAEESQCRCAPSHSNFHRKSGCEHGVTAFYWNRGTQDYNVVTVRCRCPVTMKVEKVEGTVILGDEKQ